MNVTGATKLDSYMCTTNPATRLYVGAQDKSWSTYSNCPAVSESTLATDGWT
jgi:hypothetical protein